MKSEYQLATLGAYRWVRHPLYRVAPLMFLSCGVIGSNWWIVLFSVVSVVMIVITVIPREKAVLLAKFSEPYEEYRRRVGMLIPRI